MESKAGTTIAQDESTTDNSLNTSVNSVDLNGGADEEQYSEEEFKKAEEFKTKGNEAFKGEYIQKD